MRAIVKTYLPGVLDTTLPLGTRTRKICFRRTLLEDAVVDYQMKRGIDDMPNWIPNMATWKTLTPEQKFKLFIQQFDEGYGVEFEFIN